MPSVFEFDDFRAFLGAWYKEAKATRRGVSYRTIAQKVGYSSPGFFTQILQGKTNISLETAEGFADLVGLKRRSREYFLALVTWNQAKNETSRTRALVRLESFRKFRVRELKDDETRFLESWHHAAIRELLGIRPFQGGYEQLAGTLEPRIDKEEVRASVELLSSLGMIARTSQGIERRDAALASGRQLPEELLRDYFRQLHALGARALDAFPPEERNLSWVVLSVSDRTRELLLEELRAFRRRLLEIASQDDAPTRVHLLTLMLHPLSRSLAKESQA